MLGRDYMGTMSVVIVGNNEEVQCQDWSSLTPHWHIYNKNEYFHEEGKVAFLASFDKLDQPTNPYLLLI